jgi:hypothetical protein
MTRVNRREKSRIDNQRSLTSKRPDTKSIGSVQQDELTQPNLFNEPSLRNRTDTLTLSQDSFALLTVPSIASAATKKEAVIVVKVHRFHKSSVEPYQSTSRICVKTPPKRTSPNGSNSSIKMTTHQRSASAVSVTRIRRSSSVGRTNNTNRRTRTALSNNNLSQNAVIKLK